MGVIQKQSVKSSILISIGFALGAFNMLILAPNILSPEQLGLTRMITDVGLTLANFCTLGAIPVINKFFPFYKAYLTPQKNDLPFITLVTCLVGFILVCIAGYFLRDVIERKFSANAPSFVTYSYLIYPFCFSLLLYTWLENFSWALRKTVISNTLKEVMPRLVFTVIVLLFACNAIGYTTFLSIFSFSFFIPFLPLLYFLMRTGELKFIPRLSPVTRRMGGKMIVFGGYIYAAQFLNLLSKTSDSMIISAKSANGLTDTAIFTLATYIVTLMEIPQRSMIGIAIPILAESWRVKDMKNIQHIYNKSVSNMLLIGIAMFALLWLNAHNMGAALGKGYAGIETVVLWLGLAKFIDIGTGANSQILGTSRYWRVDFYTNVIYTCLAIPLNYILISRYGLIGAVYSAVISQLLYNGMRYTFLLYKYQLQPFVWKHLLVIIITAATAFCTSKIPVMSHFIIDAIIRTGIFCVIFFPIVYMMKVSEELNQLFLKYLSLAKAKLRR